MKKSGRKSRSKTSTLGSGLALLFFNRPPHASASPFSTLLRVQPTQDPCFLQWGPAPRRFHPPYLLNRTCRGGSSSVASGPKPLERIRQFSFGCTSFVLPHSSARGRRHSRSGTDLESSSCTRYSRRPH